MTQATIRVNLNAATFPFVSEGQGRSIIVKGQDQNYISAIMSKADQDNAGIPQMFYCHNVMPSQDGLQSIGYDSVIKAPVSSDVFIFITSIIETGGATIFIAQGASGNWYKLAAVDTQWQSIPPPFAGTATKLITTATINGSTYLYAANLGCAQYTEATGNWTTVTLTGLTAANILGITTSYGYMIAWTGTTVAWSSTVTPTDFTPSLVTGAGGGGVQAVKGVITFCKPHGLGFIIYTTKNAVAALFQTNVRYPFNYREIVSCGGVNSMQLLDVDSDSGSHYAYTTDGMQIIDGKQAQTVFPEITDFLSGLLFEDFNESTMTFSSARLNLLMKKQISIISSRYIVFSYGLTSLTHALVFDISLKRWGKLKIPHVDCFEFSTLDATAIEIPRKALCFLQADGTIKQVNFEAKNLNATGVIMLGKYQYVRTRTMQMDKVEVENVEQAATFNLYDSANLDGKVGTFAQLTPIRTSSLTRAYGCRAVGINHTLAAVGAFYLTSVEISFNIHGRR